MKKLTFAFDVEWNSSEDYIKEGSVVEVLGNEFLLNRFEDSIPVIIKEAYTYDGEHYEMSPTVEWFGKNSFKELR